MMLLLMLLMSIKINGSDDKLMDYHFVHGHTFSTHRLFMHASAQTHQTHTHTELLPKHSTLLYLLKHPPPLHTPPHPYLVEDVEVPLSLLLSDDPCLLQQICLDVSTQRICLEVKVDVHVLTLRQSG